MLSRVAGSIYWMSRYLERADNVARFIYVNIHLIMDFDQKADNTQWEPLVITSGDEEDFTKRFGEASEKNVIHFLTFDEGNPNSILSCINLARENARTIREIIPSDLWEKINELYHYVHEHNRKRSVANLQEFYAHIRYASYLFTGLLDSAMSHGEGWHFARLGRMLERADKTARILDVKYFVLLPDIEYLDSPYDAVQWGAVLKSVNAFEMYRKQFQRINYKDVTQFLIFEPYFPRSIVHCMNTAERSLHAITRGDTRNIPTLSAVSALQGKLSSLTTDNVLLQGLHEFIDRFQFDLNAIDQSIYHSFFALRN